MYDAGEGELGILRVVSHVEVVAKGGTGKGAKESRVDYLCEVLCAPGDSTGDINAGQLMVKPTLVLPGCDAVSYSGVTFKRSDLFVPTKNRTMGTLVAGFTEVLSSVWCPLATMPRVNDTVRFYAPRAGGRTIGARSPVECTVASVSGVSCVLSPTGGSDAVSVNDATGLLYSVPSQVRAGAPVYAEAWRDEWTARATIDKKITTHGSEEEALVIYDAIRARTMMAPAGCDEVVIPALK